MSPVSTGPERAPRVLLDATAVPADRGGVGRYIDGLVAALSAAGQQLVVVCQRSDAERFTRIASSAEIVPGPSAISHRPARLGWAQTGVPRGRGRSRPLWKRSRFRTGWNRGPNSELTLVEAVRRGR